MQTEATNYKIVTLILLLLFLRHILELLLLLLLLLPYIISQLSLRLHIHNPHGGCWLLLRIFSAATTLLIPWKRSGAKQPHLWLYKNNKSKKWGQKMRKRKGCHKTWDDGVGTILVHVMTRIITVHLNTIDRYSWNWQIKGLEMYAISSNTDQIFLNSMSHSFMYDFWLLDLITWAKILY